MSTKLYENITDSLVSDGYIIIKNTLNPLFFILMKVGIKRMAESYLFMMIMVLSLTQLFQMKTLW
ncbi:hypothetical protein [Sulfurimonas sp.]|uniref:hypothetical protein n=1 Tax=Sulfurimonas sp. TaxID=2022749 RepID=UPI0025E0375F|nr:hypothetical protein [Sulfurimonas sp.]